MKVTGITGGVGAGKSTLMSLLSKQKNTKCIYADKIGHECMKKGCEVFEKIIFMFGEKILNSDGEIDRKKLSDIVFKEENKRAVLNSIVHPEVKNIIFEDIRKSQEAGIKYYFIEAALLMESHYDRFCDSVWYVFADDKIRRERLKKERFYSDEKITDIFSSQMSNQYFFDTYLKEKTIFHEPYLDESKEISIYNNDKNIVVIDNSGNFLTSKKLARLMDKLLDF